MSIAFIAAPIILIASVLYIAWPLLTESDEATDSSERSELELAEESKEKEIANLKDIEMDYRMGKLSAEDYERLKGEFEVRALEAIEKVDKLAKRKPPKKKRS